MLTLLLLPLLLLLLLLQWSREHARITTPLQQRSSCAMVDA
jgi:hypothetical protein